MRRAASIEHLNAGVGSTVWLRDSVAGLRQHAALRFRAHPTLADEVDRAFNTLVTLLNTSCGWDPS